MASRIFSSPSSSFSVFLLTWSYMQRKSSRMDRKPRQRDQWMTYIVKSIIGLPPQAYPNLSDELLYTADVSGSSCHQIDRAQKEHMLTILGIFGGGHIRTRTLGWCIASSPDPYPTYDLVLLADQEMERNGIPHKDRIASIVCDRILEIYTKMVEEQRTANPTAQDELKKLRFSLRRLLLQLCGDTDILPNTLFRHDLLLPAGTRTFLTGPYGDIYRTEPKPPYGRLAFKTFRIFERADGPRTFIKHITLQAVLLSCLKHPNLLEFIGLYSDRRGEFEIPFIVSPWMDFGNLEICMRNRVYKKKPIPRIRWIYEIACGLRYLHDEFVVHGNLHPKNILVDSEMHMRITDLRVAQVAEMTTTAGLTRDKASTFTWFTSPELAGEGTEPTFSSDVWSFGCLCLLIWTGEPPYVHCNNTMQFTRALLNPKCTPESPGRSVDSFYVDDHQAHLRGASLRSHVVLPCWSREPDKRPKMAEVEEIISSKFRDTLHIR